MDTITPRWKERLSTYDHAMKRLAEVVEMHHQRGLNEFEKDSLIKRFEFTYEMAWKLMMSYEKENGIVQILGSKDVVRHALALSLINNGEAWLDMIDARNKTAHVYDDVMATDIVDEIVFTYYPLMVELRKRMEEIADE